MLSMCMCNVGLLCDQAVQLYLDTGESRHQRLVLGMLLEILLYLLEGAGSFSQLSLITLFVLSYFFNFRSGLIATCLHFYSPFFLAGYCLI